MKFRSVSQLMWFILNGDSNLVYFFQIISSGMSLEVYCSVSFRFGMMIEIPKFCSLSSAVMTLTFIQVHRGSGFVCLLVGCLTSQQQASVSQGRICTDNFTCCHTEIEAADQTFHLTQSQYTDTGPTSPSADPITPGAWQGSHWSVNF